MNTKPNSRHQRVTRIRCLVLSVAIASTIAGCTTSPTTSTAVHAGTTGRGVPTATTVRACQDNVKNEMIYTPGTDTWACESEGEHS